jgi:hypothetical protein
MRRSKLRLYGEFTVTVELSAFQSCWQKRHSRIMASQHSMQCLSSKFNSMMRSGLP